MCRIGHGSYGEVWLARTAYQIVVESDYDIAGNILLNLAYFERPPNDDFAARIHLDSGNVAATATNTAATTEPGENRSAFWVFGRSVWWSWTAPANGPVTMGVEASLFNPEAQIFEDVPGGTTGLSIFVGDSPATAMPVTNRASQHFTGAPDLCQVTFDAVVGTTYQIAADGTVDLFSALTLRIAQTEPPLVLLDQPAEQCRVCRATIRDDHQSSPGRQSPDRRAGHVQRGGFGRGRGCRPR